MGRLMLTDISLAFFILMSFAAFWMALEDQKNRQWWVFLQLVASGFASLTKGPIGLLFPVLGCGSFLLLTRTSMPWRGRGFWLGVIAWTIIAVPWYAIMLVKYGWEYWNAFAIHENWERLVVAEHPSNNHFWYYPMILALGFLPWMPLLIVSVGRACREARDNRITLFLVCWFLPNLIFLTIAQSKLPSYIFFLFVPLALLMGRTLNSWLRDGFRGKGEHVTAAGIAIVQGVGLLAAPFIRPEAARYEWLAMVVAAPLSLTAIFFVWKKLKFATIGTTVSAAFIVIVALAWVAPDIESKVSTRGIASQIRSLRYPGEPLITAAFLARAVTYYGGQKPDAVESYGKQPFFTKHPLPFVRGDKGLAAYLQDKPSVFFVGQLRDYKSLTSRKSVLRDRCEQLALIGEGDDARVIFRVKGELGPGLAK
jgi:4-amino-4-deoxy-L-arabinose transferase-like glycosyltransferase